MDKKFEYIIDEIDLEGYTVKWLNGYGDGGWQMIHIEDRSVMGWVYDENDRKGIGNVTKRYVTFMREVEIEPVNAYHGDGILVDLAQA